MPWFATGIDAYRYVKDDQETDSTKCHNALRQLRYKDKEFANALDYRRGSAVRMVRNLGADMLGKAILQHWPFLWALYLVACIGCLI